VQELLPASLKGQNSVFFYQLLLLDSQSKAIQVDAIANYSHLFRRSESLFNNQDAVEEDFLEQIRGCDIDLVVSPDAEAVLGIGDQGGACHLSP
jgi:malate dehydrogenase (oxaloacetate-decarboxylating)